MGHYLDYMDTIYSKIKTDIMKKHADWKIEKDFTIYCEAKPIIRGIKFQTKLQLRKRTRTSVIFEQTFNGKKTKQYFTEYNIIKTLIFLYDYLEEEGDYIYRGMCELIKDKGTDVSFKICEEMFSFKGIKYLSHDKSFLTFEDYEIGVNDFIALLNLIIEKDRYSEKSENGKGTVLKYILFLLLCSERVEADKKESMVNILKGEKIYKGNNKLGMYKKKINETGDSKLYFKSELFTNLL